MTLYFFVYIVHFCLPKNEPKGQPITWSRKRDCPPLLGCVKWQKQETSCFFYKFSKAIDKHLKNLFTIQRVTKRKFTTCLSPPQAGEFCKLVERPVELSKLFNQRRRLPS